MAKKEKRGLGRGLSSLMGEGYHESEPEESKREEPKREEPKAAQPASEPEPAAKQPVNSFDQRIASATPDIQREAVPAAKPQPAAPAPKPVVAKPAPVKPPAPKPEPVKPAEEKPKAEKAPKPAAPSKPAQKKAPYIEEEDNVTIKGVMTREKGETDEVPMAQVKPNPDQPRTHFKPEEIEELAASIDKEGILQPVLVRKVEDGYQIVAGERRWQACKSLGRKTLSVRVIDADDDKALELALIENIQRSDLNPIEEAYGYKRLMERQGMTQSEVAIAVSKGRSTVANALRLLELPEEAQQLLFEEKITAGHARAILSVPMKDGRKKLTEKIVKDKLSVREAENLARLMSGRAKAAEQPKREPAPAYFKSAARTLREGLGTNVRIKNAKGKNKVEIEFKDEKDLERMFDILLAE